MNASNQIKGLLAGLFAVAAIGTAFAQGTPPNPNVKNPAIGAGQQSPQGTPMGMTGTPGGGGAATTNAAPRMATSPAAASPAPAAPMAEAAPMTRSTTTASNNRRTRADRN